MMLMTISLLLSAIVVMGAAPPAGWPQFGGPDRNFTVGAAGLAEGWPATGPKELWRRDLGEGFSPVAADGGRLFTMYQRGEQEVVVALDAATGRTLWEHASHAPITANMSRAPGPRSTPLVTAGAVFTTGATGRLHALEPATGRLLWTHDLFAEFKGHVQDEYYAASPLAWRGSIIVPVGGPGATVMAFDQKTGAVVWRAHDFRISDASPILIDVDGQPQAVLVMESEVVGLDPGTGALLWRHPHANRTRTNVSTPLWSAGNLLFVSSAYDSGGRMLKLSRSGSRTLVDELWFSRDLRVHVGNAVRIGDTIYGSSGDFGPTFFSALDVATGRPRWQQRDVVKGSLILAGRRFIMLNEAGELLLASPGANGLVVHARHQVLTGTSWTPPSLSGSTLYVRDRKQIAALDLR